MRIDSHSASAAVFPTGGRGSRYTIRPAGQRMKIETDRIRALCQERIVRRAPNGQLPDINLREVLTLVPLMVLILGIGVYPRIILDYMIPTLDGLLKTLGGAIR